MPSYPVPFGYELLLDLYECKLGVCDDLSVCYRFLESIVRVLQVEPQSPPFLFRTDAKQYADKAGLSGWIPLVESGVQLHTLTVKRFISIDIYSCRQFDQSAVVRFTQESFSPKKVGRQFVHRGTDYHA